jgi:nitrite reductase/ring-hydroxylating ferredoxin subunit
VSMDRSGKPLASQGLAQARSGRWRKEFPYHWDADELVSRRQVLNFAVYASGALFASTAVLAVVGAVRNLRRGDVRPIARMSDVPEGQALYFTYPEADEQAMVLHLPGGRFVAYSQRCTHLSCAVYYQPERQRLFCPCHEGVFSPETGDPVAGPPQRRLEQIAVQQTGDMLYATGIQP